MVVLPMSRPTLTLFFLLRHRLPGHALRADTSVFFARILFGNESSSQFAYKVIINQIVGTFNLEPLFYTKKIVFSALKVKHFVNLPDFLVLNFSVAKVLCFGEKNPLSQPLMALTALPEGGFWQPGQLSRTNKKGSLLEGAVAAGD